MPVPGAALRKNDTRPKRRYQLDWMVGWSPDLLTVNSAPAEVYFTSPAVTFQASSSAPDVVKSWVYVLDARPALSGHASRV